MDIRISADTRRLTAAIEAAARRRLAAALGDHADVVARLRAELALHHDRQPQCWLRADLADGTAVVAREYGSSWLQAVDHALAELAPIVAGRAMRLRARLVAADRDLPAA